MMVYTIFISQLVLVTIFSLRNLVTLNFALGLFITSVTVIVAFLLFKLKPSKVIILFFSFILNIFLIYYYWWLNFLPFLSSYFLVVETIKERGVSLNKQNLLFLPIVGLGFIPIYLKGVFTKPIKDFLFSILFSTSSTTIPSEPVSQGSHGSFVWDIASKTGSVGKELFWNNPKSVSILINLFSVVYLFIIFFIVREFIIIGRQKSYRRKKFDYLKYALIALSGILIFSISEGYRTFLIGVSRVEFSQVNESLLRLILYGTIAITVISFVIYLLLIKKRTSYYQSTFIKRDEMVFASLLGLTLLIFIVFLVLTLYKIYGRNAVFQWYEILILLS
ncbi:MAG: hypothetical protein ACP5GW_05010, partial [Caldisericaceae bacterium]